MKRATAFSPASIGNVAVGFDILGHSVAGAGDRVTVTRTTDSGVVKIFAIRGAAISLPLTAIDNTAGRALLTLLKSLPAGIGFDVEIDKGIAMGSGMGGSAASAVAAVVAANAVLDAPVSLERLYLCAMDGEAILGYLMALAWLVLFVYIPISDIRRAGSVGAWLRECGRDQ